MCVCVCACARTFVFVVCVCITRVCRYPETPERGVESSGAGIIGCCELPAVDTENQTHILCLGEQQVLLSTEPSV